MSAFGDGDPDRYDPYAGAPRDSYDGGFDRPAAYGFDGGMDEHAPRHRRGSRMLMVALIGTLALIVVGAVAFAGSLVMSRTSPPKPQAAAADASSPAGPVDPETSGAPTENATASAAPTTPGAPATTKAPVKPKATVGADTSFELQVINLVNVERRKKPNCPDVRNNDRLHAAAYKHSADMAQRNYFSHTTPDGVDFATRIKAEGYVWSSAGENIAAGQPTPEAVMKAWMNSEGHRANILNCGYRDLGVGLAYQVKNNRKYPYWTQDFGSQGR